MITTYLSEQCDVLRKQGVDKFNRPDYDYYDRNVPCRFERKTKVLKNNKGEDIVCEGLLFTNKNADIEENDKIEIGGDTYLAVAVDELKTRSGDLSHKEIILRFTDV